MKKMTETQKKIDAYRDSINQGRKKFIADDFSCVVYTYEDRDLKPCAIGFKGRSKKACFHYIYKSIDDRKNKVDGWIAEQMKIKSIRNRLEERTLEVGDILIASWGYEQTNIDFFKVVKLIGKSSVDLISVEGEKKEDSSSMTGITIPLPDKEKGEKFRRRVNGDSVKIESFMYARKMEFTILHGCRVYKGAGYSSYA